MSTMRFVKSGAESHDLTVEEVKNILRHPDALTCERIATKGNTNTNTYRITMRTGDLDIITEPDSEQDSILHMAHMIRVL